MRLIFLFTSDRPAPEGSNLPFDPSVECTNFYAINESNGLPSEGYLYLLRRMLEDKIVDEILIFIESSKGVGCTTYFNSIPCYVVPEISYVERYLEEGDIIFARGGFRCWFSFLNRRKEEGKWLLLYAANTGRQRWKFWDIVLDDLIDHHYCDPRGRFFYSFKKPVNPGKFFPVHSVDKVYDVCMGASHVHDKKGQYRAVEIVGEYKRRFGESLSCILPGRITNGVNTNRIGSIINSTRLEVNLPGMVSREELREIYNQSHLAVFMGRGGQNDRGPLESLQCGTPVLISNTDRHCYTVYNNQEFCEVSCNWADNESMALQFKSILERVKGDKNIRTCCNEYFNESNGVETVIIPEMRRLFGVIRDNPKPSLEALKREYDVI